MSEYQFQTQYPIDIVGISITKLTKVTIVEYRNGDKLFSIQLLNPQPLESVCRVCDQECFQIKIKSVGGQIEFGRYKVEIWDEDNPFADFLIDSFETNKQS